MAESPKRIVRHQSAALYRAPMFDLAAWLARWLPLGILRVLASWIGALYAFTHPRHVEIVLGNLRLLDASLDQKKAGQVYREFGKTLADYFYIGTRSPAKAVEIIAQIDGDEHLREVHRQGRGALILTGHLGLFELGGLLMAQSGFPAAALTLPEPSNALTEWRARFRQRWNVDTVEIGTDVFSFIKIADYLHQGNFVATLIDRPHPSESTQVRLPNGTSLFSSGIFLLAAHCGVPVIPATMVRRPDGFYHAQVFRPIFIKELGSRAETLQFYSQKIADIFLPVLKAYPEQWYQFVPLSPSNPISVK